MCEHLWHPTVLPEAYCDQAFVPRYNASPHEGTKIAVLAQLGRLPDWVFLNGAKNLQCPILGWVLLGIAPRYRAKIAVLARSHGHFGYLSRRIQVILIRSTYIVTPTNLVFQLRRTL
jgi:hypothetical protein